MNPHWNTKLKGEISPFLYCAVISEIMLFKGIKGVTQKEFDERWNYNEYPPSVKTKELFPSRKNIKWYIRNFLTVDDAIWNADFLAGLATCGKIHWSPTRFPAFNWNCNTEVLEVLSESPFGGNLNTDRRIFHQWWSVPALYLKSSEDSHSFMAGVLATGKIDKRKGGIYADYSRGVLPYLEKWGIPIEFQSSSKYHNLISPLWPALFVDYMPESRRKWLDIKNGGVNSQLYASVLWRMYVSNEDIKRKGIPYLRSRRWIYTHMGTVQDTEQMWLKLGFSQLDRRIITVVRSWAKNV